MPKLVLLFPTPADAATFDAEFRDEHVPLVRAQLPAVRRLESRRVLDGGYYWIAELHFDSIDSLRTAMMSPGWLRAVGHATKLSTGGPPKVLLVGDAE